MRLDEAQRLVAKLFAAFPGNREQLTAAVYIERLTPLDHDDTLGAIDALIISERWLPPVSAVLEVYDRRREHARNARKALPGPALTEEERAENLSRLQHLSERMFGRVPDAEDDCDCYLCQSGFAQPKAVLSGAPVDTEEAA